MRRLFLLTAVATAGTLIGSVVAPSASGSTDVMPTRRYLFVRVDTGDSGKLASDASVTTFAAKAAGYWAGIDNAPRIAVTVVHRVLKGTSTYPSCELTVGRDALKAAGVEASETDGVVTFLRSDYKCDHYTAHGDLPGLNVEAFGDALQWRDVAHEIGHNLGLCAQMVHDRQAPSRWTSGMFTGPTSYGNPFSMMGAGSGPPSAPCQMAAGWMRATPFPANSTARVRSLEKTGDYRAWDFTYGGFRYTVEYRNRPPAGPSAGPHAGVVIYRDGLVLETRFDSYATPMGKTVKLTPHQAITVTATARSYALVRRVTLP